MWDQRDILTKLFQWDIKRLANGTYILQNQLYNNNYATYTPLDVRSDKATVSSIWDFTLTPMQWRIDPSDREGSYVYVVLRISPQCLLIAIVIRISDLERNRYWSLPSVYLKAPVLLFHLVFVEINLKHRVTPG